MIHAADQHELSKLAEIYRAAWLFAFSHHFPPENLTRVTLVDFEDRWHGFFAKKHIHSFVYEREKVPIGFVTCSVIIDKPAEILSMMVSPTSIRVGIGSRLMEKALSFLHESKCGLAELWVVKENSNARKFYEHFNFCPTEDKRFIQRYGIKLCQLRYERQLTPF